MDFWGGSLRDDNDKKSRPLIIQEHVGDRIPIIGVGSIHYPDEAEKILYTGVPLIALGRELIMEPFWIQKVLDGKDYDIITTLSKQDQEKLIIPDGLWQVIMERKGWFPVVE
jgi:2,4-dienoyl-CoA reductase-like NADH-dependent reductase (Old Yellow Enzyme family)